MTRRHEQKAATRRAIVDAACELFDERGYAGTTLREVAKRADVALGTIFVHFPDKGSLLLAAFELDIGEVVREALATTPVGDIRAQLLHISGRLYEFYAQRPRLSRVLVQNALFLEGTEEFSTAAQIEEFLHAVEGLLAAAVARGELRSDLVAPEAALGFFADYFCILLGALRTPGTVAAQQELLGRLLALRLTGMQEREAPR